MKSSDKQILFDCVNIRCAMWAAGFINDVQLEDKINNCISIAELIEKNKPETTIYHPMFGTVSVTNKTAKRWMPKLKESSDKIVRKFFP